MSATTKPARPLAKALHTVTVVARVALLIPRNGATYHDHTLTTLSALGYSFAQVVDGNPALFDACVAAVTKAMQS
jgi:hypothetical protein